ncbi:glucosamine-6-phosphate deaminase [Neoactinobaculum massilliense]|uniref:glucosamine-6-phosphate deaminase n=1 Tax=Neoactinobaculum massilliense TaxID=2364794 RepID=UPI000F51C3B8|nr:glucosamine-6-phosphate deaminase [Neoactinobaculum massilliense]
MKVGIFETSEEASRVGAEQIISLLEKKPGATLGVATGSTPDGLYAYLRAAYKEGRFTLADSKAFALDEYVGIDPDHPEAYRNVLRRQLVGFTGLTEENLHTPNGQAADPDAAAAEYDQSIKDAGGVDLQILGIGADGHVGFNEPGISLASRTHRDALAPQTIRDNARFFDDNEAKVPRACLTQGIGTIMEARQLLLLAFGENKAEAVKQLVEGAISSRWPATILQAHPSVTVLVDEAAASKLELVDLYRARWDLD